MRDATCAASAVEAAATAHTARFLSTQRAARLHGTTRIHEWYTTCDAMDGLENTATVHVFSKSPNFQIGQLAALALTSFRLRPFASSIKGNKIQSLILPIEQDSSSTAFFSLPNLVFISPNAGTLCFLSHSPSMSPPASALVPPAKHKTGIVQPRLTWSAPHVPALPDDSAGFKAALQATHKIWRPRPQHSSKKR